MLSKRIRKFHEIVRAAHEQPSDWLVAALRDPTRNNGYMSPLARLACLRILVCRDHGLPAPSGLPYPQRKKAVRQAIGV